MLNGDRMFNIVPQVPGHLFSVSMLNRRLERSSYDKEIAQAHIVINLLLYMISNNKSRLLILCYNDIFNVIGTLIINEQGKTNNGDRSDE